MQRNELKPFTKIVWWNENDKKLWLPRLGRISKVYSNAELITVLDGMRRVYVYHISSRDFEKSYEFLRKNHLCFYPTNKSGVYEGFSHRHLPVVDGEPYILYGGAVKDNDMEAGELFTKYSGSTPTNHVGIGKLLGYPECCICFFNDVWGRVAIDPIYEAALNTERAEINGDEVTVECHPYCNNMLRYFGVRITPHIPHSFFCPRTIEWGDKWIEVMKHIDPEAVQWAMELLSSPMTWSCLKGGAIIDTPYFRGITNSDFILTKKTVNSLGYR